MRVLENEKDRKIRSSICWKPKYLAFMKKEANRHANGSVSHMIEKIVTMYAEKIGKPFPEQL